MNEQLIPKRLKAARVRKGLTQADVAKHLKVTKGTIGHWETGERNPTLANLRALATLLDTSISHLVGEESTTRHGNKPTAPELILSDHQAPPGLRDLASNKELTAALEITEDEWESLRSLKVPLQFTVQGYVAVLMAIRGNVTES